MSNKTKCDTCGDWVEAEIAITLLSPEPQGGNNYYSMECMPL